MKPRVKICCIASEQEAKTAISFGAAALGLAAFMTGASAAGGLHSGNVREAIDQVQPFGVDLCSGVRTNGHLDQKKLEAFFNALGSNVK